MNKRIRELAEEAEFSPLDIRNAFDYNEYNPYLKFAELIVKKCAMIGNYAYDNGEYPSKMIKDYFGVQLTQEEFNQRTNKSTCEGKTVTIDGIKYQLVKI